MGIRSYRFARQPIGDALAKFSGDLVFPRMRKLVIVTSLSKNYLIHDHLSGRPDFDADVEREFLECDDDIVNELVDVLTGLLVLDGLDRTEES